MNKFRDNSLTGLGIQLKKGLFSNQMVLSRDFASLMCVVLDKYQISQTESNAGMQTDNNVFIRLSTLSALKEEINPLWLQSSMHIKN